VAAAASDGRLRVYSWAPDGVPELEGQHEVPRVTACRFVDENRLLLGHLTGEVALLDVATGRERFRRQLEYDPVHALALRPGGEHAAVALRSSRVHVIDVGSGESLWILRGHRDAVYAVAWLDPDRLATAGKDKRLLLTDLSRAETPARVVYEGDRYITALAADPSGSRLAFTLDGEKVGIVDVASGRVTHAFSGHTAPPQVLIFADGGRRLLSAGNDARVLVWNTSEPGGAG
jgi:WD40 repeat protein